MASDTTTPASADVESEDELVEEELVIEEISIDGMCGVY
ncbi:MAG: mycofactocin precursor MftA [Acidimicrobiales bacterium]